MQQYFHCVTFGEILYDILNDNKEVGGAPFNVAYHLARMGIGTAMITRVGNDENGEGLLAFMQQKHITTAFVQIDYDHETSTVIASQCDAGEMSYEIKEPVAWDFIECSQEAIDVVSKAAWFIFGSLSSRNKVTEKTLLKLLELPVKKVFDINMRPPYVDKTRIEQLLMLSDVVKMNDVEFDTICNWNHIESSEDSLNTIISRYELETLIVTKGSNGAFMYHNGKRYDNSGYKVNVADTIGCGDAFLSGIIYAFINHIPPQEAVDFASKLGAFIATRSGATPDYDKQDVLDISHS